MCGSVDFSPGNVTAIALSAAYADCEFRNVRLRYSQPEKVLRNFQLQAGKDNTLHQESLQTVHILRNRNAWESIPVFKGKLDSGFRLRFEYRILSGKNGFVQVNLIGTKGNFMTIFRPNGVSSAKFFKEKSASRKETGLPSGGIPLVDGQWQTAELLRIGNRLTVLSNGKNAGTVDCDVGEFRNLTISATSADCEIRGILLNTLP